MPALGRQAAMLTGEVDIDNRYLAAVSVVSVVSTREKRDSSREVRCSGVLISPHLVLTAGHCVCTPRKTAAGEDTAVIDSSTCVTSAVVTTVTYEAPVPGRGRRSLHAELDGTVRPHPKLRLLLDRQGGVVSSTADLAVIALSEPMSLPPVELAEAEAEANESIIIVGYGSNETDSEKRRFNRSRITAALAEGRFTLERPRQQGYTDDSGGPCLREDGRTLVGISARRLVGEPSAISTASYRAWLRDEIQRASPVGSP